MSTTAGPQQNFGEPEGAGWIVFAAIITSIVGFLNVIYGIGAIDNANFFVHDTKYILSDLKTWGWITLILGAVQLIAAASIWRGGQFGRVLGIFGASFSMIAALLSIPAYPLWSLAIFAVDILIIYGLAVYGGQRTNA